MKLFGKNDAADGEETPEGAETLDDSDAAGVADGDTPISQEVGAPEGAVEGGGAEGDGEALSAPARSLISAGVGGKKKLLILAGVIGLAGLGGGGYFLLGGDTTPAVPLKPMHAPMAANPAAPVVPPGAAPGVSPVAVAQAPGAVIPPSAGVPLAPAVPATASALPSPAAAAVVPGSLSPATPVVAAGSPSLASPPADLPLPATAPPAGAPPSVAGQTSPAPAITGQAAPVSSPSAVPGAAPAANVAAAPVPGKPMPGASVSSSMEEPPQDLPMPVDMGAAPDQAPPAPSAAAMAASQAAATAAGGKAGQAAQAGKPSPAEMAIVQNAAVLDQLSQPAKPSARPFDPSQPPPNQADALKTVDQLLEQQAIIRPLPPDWVHVSVDHPAGGADERLNAAREALAQGNNLGALQLFSDLLQKSPRDKRALMGKAVALQKMGQDDDALAAYESVLNNDPKNLEALTNMLGLLKLRDPKLALDKLVELREAYPYQADITAQLGVAYGGLGQYDAALKYLEMAEALDPSSAYVIYNKAVVCDKMGRSRQAGDLYREILRLSADGQLKDALPLEAIRNRLAVMR